MMARVVLFLIAAAYASSGMGNVSEATGNFICLGLALALGLSCLLVRAEGETPKDESVVGLSSRIPVPEPPLTPQANPAKRSIHVEPSRTAQLLGHDLGSLIFCIVLLLISMLLVLAGIRTLKLFGLSVLLFACHFVLDRIKAPRKELPILMLTATLFALFLALNDYVPHFWYILHKSSLFLSMAIEAVTGRHIMMGYTYAGLPLAVLFLLFIVSTFLFSINKKPLFFLAALCSVLAANGVYLALWTWLTRSALASYLEAARPLISSLDPKPVLMVLLLVPAILYYRSERIQDVPPWPDRREGARVAVAFFLLIISFATITLHLSTPMNDQDIAIYDNGQIDRRMPVFGEYGLRRIGMFGLLPEYLRARGRTVKFIGTVSSESLGNVGTLVLINLMESLDESAREAILRFVRVGGSLLVLGDHTGDKQIRLPFNELLATYGVTFNFDSAIPLRTGWVNGYDPKPHPILHNISEVELQIGVGASLDVLPPARPILVGRHGFSDAGNRSDSGRGYLGDMKHTFEEQLGDVVLVAEARSGKGKVLVFGDTSSFQNGAIAHSHRFIDNVFNWLAAATVEDFHPYGVLASFALLIAFLVLFLHSKQLSTGAVLASCAALSLVTTIAPAVSAVRAKEPARFDARVAAIDFSHLERCSLNPGSPSSLDGLAVNFLRNGYIPIILRDFSDWKPDQTRILAIVAPAAPFGANEILSIRKFVFDGGLLLLAAGWHDSEALKPLLDSFAMGTRNIPLGKIGPDQNQMGVSLMQAWPVTFDSRRKPDVLVEGLGFPVIALLRYEQGGVLLIGDSTFLQNKSLEGVDNFTEGNISFLRHCLNEFAGGRTAHE